MRFNFFSLRQVAPVSALILSCAVAPCACGAEGADFEDTQFKFQFTDVQQYHGHFNEQRPAWVDESKYSGNYPVYSLTTDADRSFTRTFSGYFGVRPWTGGEVYLNLEVTSGMPFTEQLIGMGGFYNGEITKASGTSPKMYRPRLFLRQTWNEEGEDQQIESDLNFMAGTVSKNRFVLTLGNFSLLDVFDKNAYSSDPRRQFFNWGNMCNLAWDYAADARGYGWGFATEWYRDDWVVRYGRMTGPWEPNVLPIDYRIFEHYGEQIEVEHDHEIGGQPGAIRFITYRNRAEMASFRDAINYGNSVGWAPDPTNGMEYILNVRNAVKVKYGFGVNLDQALSSNIGIFFRGLWSDGQTETYAFGEVDRSISTGIAIKGADWGRAQDTLGISFLENFLSKDRREYLEKGGISFFIGDVWLNYRPEQIFESYYSIAVTKKVWLTGDIQRVWNPAYNADRGPLNILGARLHAEF